MNVVLFSEVTVERVIGGAERVLRQQSLGLAKLGHQVRVVGRRPRCRAVPVGRSPPPGARYEFC